MIKLRQAIEEKTKLWNEAIKSASSEKIGLRLLRDKKRWLCRNDLYYLGIITGHSIWKSPMVKGFVEHFHRPFCDIVSLINWQIVSRGIMSKHSDMLKVNEVVDDPKELGKLRRLFLKFRSSYKSTIVTKLKAFQLALNFPNLHQCISHNTQINASDILVSIKEMFLTPEIKRLFPEYIPNTKEWGNKTGFSVDCRTDRIMPGDNIEAIGIGTRVTGRKYHLFNNDDIVDEFSVTNEEQLRQSIDYLESHKNLFVNPSFPLEDYSDTTYHFADVTIVLQDDPDVDTYKEILLKEDKDGDIEWQKKKYICILPEHFTKEGIGKEGVSGLMKDVDMFNKQYMLNPLNPKKKRFTPEMIQTYQYIPTGLTNYLVIDSADSEEKRACYTAMEVWGIDYDDNWYWLDGVFDKIDDRERIDAAIMLAKKWRVFEVLWEYLSYGRTDQRNFERASRLVPDPQRTWTTPRIIKASKQSKDDRILGLNDRYSRHKVFWPPRLMYYSKFEGKTIDIVRAMEYEFRDFPLCSHKDLLDCNSFLLQIDLIKGDKGEQPKVSKFAHIKDPQVRSSTEIFWRDWDKWKATGFATPEEVTMVDNL